MQTLISVLLIVGLLAFAFWFSGWMTEEEPWD